MTCTVCGAVRILARGMCNKHYKRWYREVPLNQPDREPAILHKHHPFYVAWVNMKTRCYNQNSTQYKWYGGRGIKVCERWHTFKYFYEDMFDSWHSELELDRRDTNRDYEPDNCRWITHQENCLNRRKRAQNV
jgi:hypothetical protein